MWQARLCLKNVRVQLGVGPNREARQTDKTEAASATIFPLREMVSKEIKKQLEMNILKRVTDDAMGCQHRNGHEKGRTKSMDHGRQIVPNTRRPPGRTTSHAQHRRVENTSPP